MAKLKYPDEVENPGNTVNIEGQTYQADKNGVFEVPDDKAHLLIPHGLVKLAEEAKLEKVSKTGEAKTGDLKKDA